jgi:hypothetical protein
MMTPYEGGVHVPIMIFFLMDTYLASGSRAPMTKYAPTTNKK